MNQKSSSKEEHNHSWQFIKTFIADGKPKIKEQLIVPPIGSNEKPKMKMWTDSSQEYAEFICECGKRKTVESPIK